MKVYIAYEGYLNRHDYQTYNILGLYTNEGDAHNAVQQTITESGVEITPTTIGQIPTTWWVEHGMESVIVGKVEEHTLIG